MLLRASVVLFSFSLVKFNPTAFQIIGTAIHTLSGAHSVKVLYSTRYGAFNQNIEPHYRLILI